MLDLKFKQLEHSDLNEIVEAFKALGWNKPRSQYEQYCLDQSNGVRSIIVCKCNSEFAGYVTIIWNSQYLLFKNTRTPEISDLNVLPKFRKNGIGTRLILECEKMAKARDFQEIGLGVGLISDYASAQRLYFRLGYIPDGRGLHYGIKPVKYGQFVRADDDLVIYLKKIVKSHLT